MQSSRQKAPCAYAKVCKSKPKNNIQPPKNQVPPSPRSKRCDNIYEELMNQLDLDESEYIQKLCKKNQLKIKKLQQERQKKTKNQKFQDITNFPTDPSQKSIKNAIKQPINQPQSKFDSNSSLKTSNKQIVTSSRRQSSKKIEISSQQSFTQFDQPSNRFFLSNLDTYIARLNENQTKLGEAHCDKNSLNKYQSQGQRQFRRTVEVATPKHRKESSDLVSRAKYSKLLDKLHEQLVERQALEYKLECKDMKVTHMKSIIQSMYEEIAVLRKQLEQEREEKEKYSSMAEEFASKVHHVRRSKDKHYIPQHQKRRSHVPSSSGSYSNDFSDFFNRTGWQDGTCATKLRHGDKGRDREQASTLKKKGMHKYKISEFIMDGSEIEHQKASIYHDSYL